MEAKFIQYFFLNGVEIYSVFNKKREILIAKMPKRMLACTTKRYEIKI